MSFGRSRIWGHSKIGDKNSRVKEEKGDEDEDEDGGALQLLEHALAGFFPTLVPTFMQYLEAIAVP